MHILLLFFYFFLKRLLAQSRRLKIKQLWLDMALTQIWTQWPEHYYYYKSVSDHTVIKPSLIWFVSVAVVTWRGVTFKTSSWRRLASQTPRKMAGQWTEAVTTWTIGLASELWTAVAWWKPLRAGSTLRRSTFVASLTWDHQCKTAVLCVKCNVVPQYSQGSGTSN